MNEVVAAIKIVVGLSILKPCTEFVKLLRVPSLHPHKHRAIDAVREIKLLFVSPFAEAAAGFRAVVHKLRGKMQALNVSSGAYGRFGRRCLRPERLNAHTNQHYCYGCQHCDA